MGDYDERLEQLVDEDLNEETSEQDPTAEAPVEESNPETEPSEPDSVSESKEEDGGSDDIPYTPEEIKRLGLDKLDPNKLPPELVPFYRSMQGDYTRKMQRIAEARESELRNRTQGQEQKAQAPDPKQFVSALAEAAKARACSMLGVAVDNFDEFDPQHHAAFSAANYEIQQQLASMRQEQLGQQRAKQTFESVVNEFASQEPNFERIGAWVDDWALSLPVSKYEKVLSDVRSGDPARVKAVVEEVRKSWYEAHRPKKATPPKVVSPGVGSPNPAKRHITGKEFAAMSEQDQLNALSKFLEE